MQSSATQQRRMAESFSDATEEWLSLCDWMQSCTKFTVLLMESSGCVFAIMCLLICFVFFSSHKHILIASEARSVSFIYLFFIPLCRLSFTPAEENHGQHGGWAARLLPGPPGLHRHAGRHPAPPLAQHSLRGLQHHHRHRVHEGPVDGVRVAKHRDLPVRGLPLAVGAATRPAGRHSWVSITRCQNISPLTKLQKM